MPPQQFQPETLLHLMQVPEPDGEGWPDRGRHLPPVHFSKTGETYGAQGRTPRPAGLSARPQDQHGPAGPSVGPGLLQAGIVIWAVFYCCLIFNGLAGLLLVFMTASVAL